MILVCAFCCMSCDSCVTYYDLLFSTAPDALGHAIRNRCMLTVMTFRSAAHLLLLLFTFLTVTVTAQTRGPVIEEFSPQAVSANSVLVLHGYRLHPSSPEKINIYFIQNGNTYPARTGGGSSVTNDEHNGRQTLEVIVPEEVMPGPTQVIVETHG